MCSATAAAIVPWSSSFMMICNSNNPPQQIQSMLMLSTTNSRFPLPRRRRPPHTHTSTSNFSWMATMEKNNRVVSTSTTTTGHVIHPTSVPVRVARELHQAGHRYLDVRTPGEFSAGHAAGAINIPYMFKVGSGMTKNPNFVDEVLTHFRKDDEIIVGCQFGKRSLMAATDLLSAGFTGVTDVAGGFAAWSRNELPVEA